MAYAVKTKMWQPVLRDGWHIKFSQYRDCYILLTLMSTHTGQTVIRYFNGEDEACNFINYVVQLDAFHFQETLY